MSEEVLLTETCGNVLVMTLNRPHVRNAFDQALAEALSTALDELDDNSELRVGVLTGVGPTFSAGMDLKALLRGERSVTEKRGGFGIMSRPPEKPLIAALQGDAVAGGLELALCCDLIVAAETAKMGLPEVKRGLVAVGGSLFRLPRRIPYHVVMELALTGDRHPASRLQRLGLVNAVVPEGQALATALTLAERIAENAPLAVAATKQIVRESFAWDERTAWRAQGEIAARALRSEDAREGARAFAEKRAPVWRGR